MLALGAITVLTLAQAADAQGGGMPPAGMPPAAAPDAEVPHPFFTHMGLPEGVGVYSLRLLGTLPRVSGATTGDFAFHFETGLTSRIGLHVRNDRWRTNDRTEAMFQFAALVSANDMNGFAPLIEFEVPTRAGISRINTLAGFSSSLGASRWGVNQVVHYNPREDMVDGSLALVVTAGRSLFPVFEVLGKGGTGQASAVDLLAGVKLRLREGIVVRVAYERPVTAGKDFSSQLAFGPELGRSR